MRLHITRRSLSLSLVGGIVAAFVTGWIEPIFGSMGLYVPKALSTLQIENIDARYGPDGIVVGVHDHGLCSEMWVLWFYDNEAAAMRSTETTARKDIVLPPWVEVRADQAGCETYTVANGFPLPCLKWSLCRADPAERNAIRLTGKRGVPDGELLPCGIIWSGFAANASIWATLILISITAR
ncbi:MAG: hypothetical protein U0638_13955 [Phycisphaerales bacterium]